MPKNNAVWGIDIGQCALKALRCEPHETDPRCIVTDQFDYIEYPKILSQPEADAGALVKEALELFLSRNAVRGDHVAISVSGQSGLARFIKLPPVESSKIPDIVKFEARQQIPFSLDDVVWDYQKMDGGSEDEGFSLETEVGLFAMKRDVVYKWLKPLEAADIEVDFIQLTPLAIYNAIVFDLMTKLPPPEEYDPDDPPESMVVLSLGTDSSDLVVTNGYRVWQRSLPIGGSHFTKALSKELKLTFAKAEHLKRHADTAEDRKAVYQAMKPAFADMLTELERSIGFFTNLDRTAKIGQLVTLGNGMRLPGLRRFLSKNLGYEVKKIESYRGLVGGAVTEAPTFRDNVLSFAVCYGLCLQGLGRSKLSTNLLPPEITTERIIRDKKPWAVTALAALLFGCAFNFVAHWLTWNDAHPERYDAQITQADNVDRESSRLKNEFSERVGEYERIKAIGQNLTANAEKRLLWLEVLRAIDAALPRQVGEEKDIEKRYELHITSLDCEHFADVSQWYNKIRQAYAEDRNAAAAAARGAAPEEALPEEASPPGDNPLATGQGIGQPAAPAETPQTNDPGPSGPGWVIQLTGYHYHNHKQEFVNRDATFVRNTLLKNLENGTVELPNSDGTTRRVALADLGISYPVLVKKSRLQNKTVTNPNLVGEKVRGKETRNPDATIELRQFQFVVHFCWQPTSPSERRLKQQQQQPLAPGAQDVTASVQPGSRR